MTKEECIGLLKRYAEYNGMGIPNLAGCREAMRTAAELLQQPSLPSNLDEAAEEYGRKEYSHAIHFWDEGLSKNKPEVMKEDFVDSFKAGAEWMAKQGVSMLGRVGIYGVDVESTTEELRKAGFKLGEEVVLQIREK